MREKKRTDVPNSKVTEESYDIEDTFEESMDTDENVKPFSCSLCPSTFTQRGNLLRHIATIHEGKKRTDVPNSKVTEESFDTEEKKHTDVPNAEIKEALSQEVEENFEEMMESEDGTKPIKTYQNKT